MTSTLAPMSRWNRRSRRTAAAVLAATTLFAAGPAITVAKAAEPPRHEQRPHVRGGHRPPTTTVDLARTSREPRPADVAGV